jgi:glycosyltransferase involved in cell wall biosynthesis
MTKIPIVYHGQGIRWSPWRVGRHIALMEAMAETHPVVILDAPHIGGGLFRKRKPWLEPIHENLVVIRNAFSWRPAKIGSRLDPFSAFVDAAWVRAALRRIGVREYVFWLGSAAPERVRWMNTSRLVYDCLDPCFDPRWEADFERRERELAARAKLVFASAERLAERLRGFGAPLVHHLPNGTDRVFDTQGEAPPMPEELVGKPRPYVGYMGTLDGRFDFEAVEAAARAHPDKTFCLVGRLNRDQAGRAIGLQSLPNVVMPGSAKRERAVAFNYHFDVGLIPFRLEPVNDSLDPVKLYMYLLHGKPVVASATHECRRRASLLYLADSPADWAEAVGKAVAEDAPELRAQRIRYAMDNDWRHRAREALAVLQQHGLLTRGPSRDARPTAPATGETVPALIPGVSSREGRA